MNLLSFKINFKCVDVLSCVFVLQDLVKPILYHLLQYNKRLK